MQVADLTIRALCVDRVLKSVENFLQGQHIACSFLCHFPYVSVRPRAHLLAKDVFVEDMLLDLLGHYTQPI